MKFDSSIYIDISLARLSNGDENGVLHCVYTWSVFADSVTFF